MFYEQSKVYNDGSHYIAIIKDEHPKPNKKSSRKNTDVIVINNEELNEVENIDEENKNVKVIKDSVNNKTKIVILLKNIFEDIYKETIGIPKKERKVIILNELGKYIKDDELLKEYVERNLERKERNQIVRRVRIYRKIALHDFNYFATFTYNSKLHTEESFKKGLKITFRNLSYRKDWKYLGVWERSPELNRLHFHGLFDIPEGSMPGELIQVKDYSFNKKKRIVTNQNTYFNKRFGRTDFEYIENDFQKREAIKYITKYIEKSGERIISSKGLKPYILCDVDENDVICETGIDGRKLILTDDFTCWDEGMLVGRVSKEVIDQMPLSN